MQNCVFFWFSPKKLPDFSSPELPKKNDGKNPRILEKHDYFEIRSLFVSEIFPAFSGQRALFRVPLFFSLLVFPVTLATAPSGIHTRRNSPVLHTMPAHLVQNVARSWASVDLVPNVVLSPKTFATAVEAIEDSNKAVVPSGVNECCPYPASSSASTVIDHQPTFASTTAAVAAVKVAEAPSPSVSLQMLPFVGHLDTPRSVRASVGLPCVFEHGYRRAEPPQNGSAMPPHGVAAAGADDHHVLHAEGSPPRARNQRSPQTVVPHHPRSLEVSSGYRAPALWDEAGPKGSPAGFTSELSETTADATSSSTSSAAATAGTTAAGAASSGGAMARPSLCLCKKLAVGTMLIADSAAISSAAGATAAGSAGAGAGGPGAAERPGRVCASRGKEVR